MAKEKLQIEAAGTQDELLTVDEVATQSACGPHDSAPLDY